MKELVLGNTGRTDKDIYIDTYLKRAVVEIGRRHNFKSLQVETDLSIGENAVSIPLPSDTIRLLEARLINGTQSTPMPIYSKAVVVRQYPSISSMQTGVPSMGYEQNNVIYFLPPSNGSYTIRVTCIKAPAALLAPGDTCDIPDSEDALVAYATASVYRSLQQYQDATYWMTEFERSLAAAIRCDINVPATMQVAQASQMQSPHQLQPWLDPFAGFDGQRK
jgi:hypothetical protein